MSKLRAFFSFNNSWKLNFEGKEMTIEVTCQKKVLVNGQEVTFIINKNFLRLEFVYEDHVFYISPGKALPFLGFNSQLYMDQVNVLNGKPYTITPFKQRLAVVIIAYLLGAIISFWALIPIFVYLLGLFLFFRRRTYTVHSLPAQLVNGGSVEEGASTDAAAPLVSNYTVYNPIMTDYILPLCDKVKGLAKKNEQPQQVQYTYSTSSYNMPAQQQTMQPMQSMPQMQQQPMMQQMPVQQQQMQQQQPMQQMPVQQQQQQQQPMQHMPPMQQLQQPTQTPMQTAMNQSGQPNSPQMQPTIQPIQTMYPSYPPIYQPAPYQSYIPMMIPQQNQQVQQQQQQQPQK
ncbi:hypothetical protein SAMD00019534_065260 [Acytostelium subglobosum LB1]|uniref:hypothetical protein n=1 Tax=Acytostelium subglobosum LB1 TaxID=1410327 RepID=UPI000645135E|nr:hypothetical protein SAMD00019534_065260 [Acytostelium subglobosum LB1]GAM23351.1 hypothetical protein SAMD00019534_065260 [Acytostelium subglobosum LB1]|eukprot:XP_012753800.1 hypothetical protein SAMD00019534_065260 [Acytostelium subglobosum LB1]